MTPSATRSASSLGSLSDGALSRLRPPPRRPRRARGPRSSLSSAGSSASSVAAARPVGGAAGVLVGGTFLDGLGLVELLRRDGRLGVAAVLDGKDGVDQVGL